MAQERYKGIDCTLTIGSAFSQWTSYDFEINIKDKDCRAAGSDTEQRVVISKDASLKVKGYRGGSETFADLAEEGSTVSTITFTDEPANFSDFTGWKITKKSMSQSADDVGTYELELKPGFLPAPTP